MGEIEKLTGTFNYALSFFWASLRFANLSMISLDYFIYIS